MMHEADLYDFEGDVKKDKELIDTQEAQEATSSLPDEKRRILELELEEVEDEIHALQITLQSRIHRANELKGLLGHGVLTEIRNDLITGITTIRQSETYSKTTEALKNAREKTASALTGAKDVVTHGLVDVKNSAAMKNVQGALGNAYSGVMGVLSGSAFGYGAAAADEEVEEAVEVTTDINSTGAPNQSENLEENKTV